MTLQQIAERLDAIGKIPIEGFVDSHDTDGKTVWVDTTDVHRALDELRRDIEAYVLRVTGTL